ncbi:3-deoxy-D-manno-octulosonic acid transferase [Leptotrichia buccalis]|uniref:3-deoxy-D-manno-octulosonic acid transferase n=1 Tax=Leptotrichia buccalis (strain ATCC 14201 / DSM 1135 / JCM 12969 / NCTC 10249 / C-1013-b) TaxID=523794 RepID=C7N8X3_LEPBD|nr:glycosyltransferase N-terminal domain-containing protein [Leptotrichia buccalis]ACV38604.1 Three-deoxy-D-manno-octulosonic-acid transferase domain protein [Leptotrichia buccalis C-1013-b]
MILYNLLRILLYFVIMILAIFNGKLLKFFKSRLFQKIGNDNFLNEEEEATLIHFSSVGEFNLSQELIEKILKSGENRKKEKVILSVMTDTGFSAVNKKYSENDNVKVFYFPLDDFFVLRKIYKKYKIKKTIIIETEIWPNLYYFAAKNGKLFIVNGRLTERKLKSYLKFNWFIKNTINRAEKIMVQSDFDKKRYEKLGISENKIKVYKNLKYSIKYNEISDEKKKYYFDTVLDKNKKIIVCGSTRPDEEKIWLEVLKKINQNNEYQLVLVPRHLERIGEIEKIILEKFSKKDYLLLTAIEKNKINLEAENKKEIVIIDKMGILTDFYQLADFVFVGGTLVNIGGHSILEPLFYGKKPIIGKYFQNIEEIVRDAQELGFIEVVENENEIIEYLKKSENVNTKRFFEKNNEIDKILNEIC